MPALPPSEHRQPAVPRSTDEGRARLLVAEDDVMLADMLLDTLTFAGYEVEQAATVSAALARIPGWRPDLMLLDVNLPDLNGFEVASRLRAARDGTPLIFLTARDAPEDLRDGFLAGGDDYLTKPFRLEELRLRIAAVLRRTLPRHGREAGRLAIAGLVLDEGAHRVWRDGREIELTSTEFRLLRFLMRNVDAVFSRADLLREVWGYRFDSDTSLVETYISYLRRKIDRSGPSLIHTVRGVGYTLRDP